MTAFSTLSRPLSYSLRKILPAAAFLSTVMIAFFFRTYPLQSGRLVSDQTLQRLAGNMIRGQMRKQIELRIMTGMPQLTDTERARLAEQKLEELIEKDRAAFQETVARAASGMAAQRNSALSYRYLSEADPYYYLNLTQNVLATGHLGTRIAGGRFFNPLRHAPFGNPDVINLHPYVGAAVYHLLHLMRPHLSVMRAVGFTPLFLILLAALTYFGAWPLFDIPLVPWWLGAQIFFLAPVVIQRSTLGWYDTDPYNLIFPLLIFATLLAVFKKPRWAVPLALVGGLLTGFYPLWWQGWTFILGLTSFAAFMTGGGLALRGSGEQRFSVLTYAVLYTVSSLGFAVLLMTPAGFWDTIVSDISYSSRVQGGGASDFWPNLLVMVGETNQESVKKWIYLTSHYGAVAFAFLGLVLPPARRRTGLPWLAVVLMALPLILFSFTAERFSILAVLPVALLAAYGMRETLELARDTAEFLTWAPVPARKAVQVFAFVIVTLAILPRSLIGAHVAGFQSHFIMNDAWYGVFEDLKNSAPKDAIVDSWWPPGYFINAISGLRSVVDGGSHHFHENFWMAKAFMSRDERESCGLFRMLAAGGNHAMEFLEDHGIHGDPAVALILKVVATGRQKASGFLPAEWSAKEKEAFLDATHGHGPLPPVYVLIYEDMMAQNLALQVVDAWSFEKAQRVFGESPKKNFWESLASRGVSDYTRKMIQVTGPGLPNEPPAAPASAQGRRIFFKNGLGFETDTGRAFYRLGGRMIQVRGLIKRGDRWETSEPEQDRIPMTAIVLPAGDGWMAVAAHRDLIPTTLFQLTYLDAQERPRFKLVSSHGSIQNSDYVYAYRIDWSQLES